MTDTVSVHIPDFGPRARWFHHPLAWWRSRRCDRWVAAWEFPGEVRLVAHSADPES